jgi:hypothetical protein
MNLMDPLPFSCTANTTATQAATESYGLMTISVGLVRLSPYDWGRIPSVGGNWTGAQGWISND